METPIARPGIPICLGKIWLRRLHLLSLIIIHSGMAPQLLREPLLYLRHLVTPYSAAEKAGLGRSLLFAKRGMGYFHEQATQPQTLGYSLADSPVGLLAWIYEKLVNWTDNYPWADDEGKWYRERCRDSC